MKRILPLYTIIVPLALALMVSAFATPASAEKYPNVDYLIGMARMTSAWHRPPMGGPVQQIIKDPETGKEYIVSVSYWSTPRVISEFPFDNWETFGEP